MPSSLLTVKDAVKTACDSLFASSALVTFGHPGYLAGLPENIVAVRGARSTVAEGPMGRSRRATDEDVEVDVVISCWSGTRTQRDVTATASGYLDSLTDYCATSATTALGGAGGCLWSLVSGWELAETEDPEDMAAGRVAEIAVTITARCRR